MEETVMQGTSKDGKREETSKRLRTVRSLIAKYGHDPTYKVKSKGSKFYGYDIEKLKEEEYNLETIKAHREHAEKFFKRKQPLLTQQLQEKKSKLKHLKNKKKEKFLEPLWEKKSCA